MCANIWLVVIGGGFGYGSGKVLCCWLFACCGCCGCGGKKVFAKMEALPLLSSVVEVIPSAFFDFSDGILGIPSSPGGSLRYLLAVHISSADISSR